MTLDPRSEWAWHDSATDRASANRRARRNKRTAWLPIVTMGVVLSGFLGGSAWPVVLGCLAIGGDDFRIARWIKRVDTNRVRGRMCARFYQAWGLWKISVTAMALMFVFGFIHEGLVRNGLRAKGVPPRESLAAMLLGIIGFILSAMLSNLAVGSALRHRIKVWVGARANHAETILYSALITNAILLVLVVLFVGMPLLDAKAIPSAVVNIAVIGCFVLLVFGAPVLILLRLDAFRQRIIAASPDECWPDDPELPDRLCYGEDWE